ncbi:MAG: response regulator [Nitrospirae bacterium]|nr:response regulator [Nitrospirota bacterium]
MGKTILIVDDSASMRQLVTFTLRGAGYEVVEAVDGADAVSKLNAGIDAIVTDLNMPNMNGLEFLRNVRKNQFFKFTPVVMLTTESQQSQVLEAKEAGVSGWIVKPFTPERLIEIVKRYAR